MNKTANTQTTTNMFDFYNIKSQNKKPQCNLNYVRENVLNWHYEWLDMKMSYEYVNILLNPCNLWEIIVKGKIR